MIFSLSNFLPCEGILAHYFEFFFIKFPAQWKGRITQYFEFLFYQISHYLYFWQASLPFFFCFSKHKISTFILHEHQSDITNGNKNPLHLSMCCKIFYYQALKCCNSIMYHSCIHFLQSDRHKSIIKYTTAYASIYCAIISVSLSQC